MLKPSALSAAGGLAAALALSVPPTAAASPSRPPPLAVGVEAAADWQPTAETYVVANETPVFKTPSYSADQETGVVLKRGENPQVLGQANSGLWLLIGRAGKGIGYAPRSLLCPANLCRSRG